jgi:hypothetical protein
MQGTMELFPPGGKVSLVSTKGKVPTQGTLPRGRTNGEGLFGMWFVATPNLPVQGGGSTSGGYGY